MSLPKGDPIPNQKNKDLLERGLIEPWQFSVREHIPLSTLPKTYLQHQKNPQPPPPCAPKWAGGIGKSPHPNQLTWSIMETIEKGIQSDLLHPYEASLQFEIPGEEIQKFLESLKLPIKPTPQWIPKWARTQPLQKPSLHGVQHYLASIPEYEEMDAEEELRLIKISRSKNKKLAAAAEEKLLLTNLRLVVSIARKNAYNTPIEDLISEGNLGLRTAIQKYKPGMGARLSTYASWWVKQSIRKALNDSKTIRIPLHQQQNLKRIQETILKLTEITGHIPSDEEIAEETKIKAHTIHRLRNLTSPMLSLQYLPNGETEGKTYAETLKDTSTNGLNPLEKLSQKHAQETLEKMKQRFEVKL